jgi:chromate transporter
MLRDEVVEKRGWMDDDRFLDLLGATNLIPGPNSTEMVIHVGYLYAGWPGLLVSGVSFILPAALIVGAIAWGYVQFGSTPQVQWILYGIKPVAIALIVKALWMLGKRALRTIPLAMLGLSVVALYFLGVNELILLFAGGVILLVIRAVRNSSDGMAAALLFPLAIQSWITNLKQSIDLSVLFFTFLKIGSVLYGSGYVLLAFLHSDFVARLGWLSDQQLIDAVAVGQVTPGPVFTTSTFIGYLLGGLPGALLGTIAIFTPSFLFVGLTNPLIPKLRSSAWAGHILDGVNASAVGLMAAVTIILSRETFIDFVTPLIALAALIAVFRTKINPSWLILAGGLIGWLRFVIF